MDEMVCILIGDGWREYDSGLDKWARCFYKRFDTSIRCRCNSDKAGIQVVVKVSREAMCGKYRYELDVCGELADGTWVKIDQWSMPSDLREGLKVIPRMLATWEFIANYKA